jgi:hypothetical protein
MGRASRRKRHRDRRADFAAMRGSPTRSTAELRTPPPQLGRISEALRQLVEPYRHEADSLDSFKTLVALGALAWNFALLPEAERDQYLMDGMRKLDAPDLEMLQSLLEALMRRKQQLFPHDRRMIVSSEVTLTPAGYHITVASLRPDES